MYKKANLYLEILLPEKKSENPLTGGEAIFPGRSKRRFNSLIVESFHEAIRFGEVILFFLELNSSVRRSKIAENPELFESKLHDILGDSTPIIKERIIRNLCAKIGIDYEIIANLNFSDQIREAQKIYLNKTNRPKNYNHTENAIRTQDYSASNQKKNAQ